VLTPLSRVAQDEDEAEGLDGGVSSACSLSNNGVFGAIVSFVAQ
jgi:hypothetical protein